MPLACVQIIKKPRRDRYRRNHIEWRVLQEVQDGANPPKRPIILESWLSSFRRSLQRDLRFRLITRYQIDRFLWNSDGAITPPGCRDSVPRQLPTAGRKVVTVLIRYAYYWPTARCISQASFHP
jgi:hypothetical protein